MILMLHEQIGRRFQVNETAVGSLYLLLIHPETVSLGTLYLIPREHFFADKQPRIIEGGRTRKKILFTMVFD